MKFLRAAVLFTFASAVLSSAMAVPPECKEKNAPPECFKKPTK